MYLQDFPKKKSGGSIVWTSVRDALSIDVLTWPLVGSLDSEHRGFRTLRKW